MRSEDIIILLAAGAIALYVVKQARAQAAPASTQQSSVGMTSEQLGWYLQDIYSRLNGQYAT